MVKFLETCFAIYNVKSVEESLEKVQLKIFSLSVATFLSC